MTLRFGTDGVRGAAYTELTTAFATAVGRAAARVLTGGSLSGDNLTSHRFVIGRDTRESGPDLEAAVAAGMVAEGCSVERLGVVPTPTVAWAGAADGVPGAVISASHNPYTDNGIKLFAAGGRKLDDDAETLLEAEVDRIGAAPDSSPTGSGAGEVVIVDRTADYVRAVADSIEGRRLAGLRVIVDCAHGSASGIAPGALADLGAEVESIHDAPDGTNINADSGSTHPGALQRRVVAAGADVGLAFDGDADRVLAVTSDGHLIDGDHLIAMAALDRRDRSLLTHDTVVVTVMTNLGFRLSMADRDIGVVETPVGDRYVLAALERGGYSLGGEQSGHVIYRDLATTGDGLLTSVQTLDLMVRSGRSLAALAEASMRSLPQVLHNLATSIDAASVIESIGVEIAQAQADLGDRGRVLVRPSGTEPLVRVMVEAETAEVAESVASRLIAAAAAVS